MELRRLLLGAISPMIWRAWVFPGLVFGRNDTRNIRGSTRFRACWRRNCQGTLKRVIRLAKCGDGCWNDPCFHQSRLMDTANHFRQMHPEERDREPTDCRAGELPFRPVSRRRWRPKNRCGVSKAMPFESQATFRGAGRGGGRRDAARRSRFGSHREPHSYTEPGRSLSIPAASVRTENPAAYGGGISRQDWPLAGQSFITLTAGVETDRVRKTVLLGRARRRSVRGRDAMAAPGLPRDLRG